MRLTDHAAAAAELVEAAEFYERRAEGLGTRFFEAVQRALLVIEEAPERWTRVETGVRGYRVSGFPYTVYYRILPDCIQVVAYKHQSRRPDYWRARLKD